MKIYSFLAAVRQVRGNSAWIFACNCGETEQLLFIYYIINSSRISAVR